MAVKKWKMFVDLKKFLFKYKNAKNFYEFPVKCRTFPALSHYRNKKDRRRLMLVHIYLKIYEYTRGSALKILHKYY